MVRKGMTQTMALIVAAAVLVMAAVTLVFMTQDSIGSLFSDSSRSSCISSIEAQCSEGPEATAPPACDGVEYNGETLSIAQTVSCDGSTGTSSSDSESLDSGFGISDGYSGPGGGENDP